MKTPIFLAAAAALATAHGAQAAPLESTSATTSYHRVEVEGVGIFYREAGPNDAPTIVLLHGFPSSSREFDTLIPLLATRYHLIAPDFPGFGQSDAPPPAAYAYTFDHLAKTIDDLLAAINVKSYSLYLSKPGQREIQAALLYDYRTNVASYPAWQAWLRRHQPATLVAWGANDPSLTAPGAEAFKRDLQDAEIHLLDAGHFALDEKTDEIARLILDFMAKQPG